MNEYSVIIPVRVASKRIAMKPLLKIGGLPIFVYLFKRISKDISETYIATADQEIMTLCKDYKVSYIKTSRCPKNGSERVSEAVSYAGINSPIIVNLQVDEIDADLHLIKGVVNTLIKKNADVSTAITPLKKSERNDIDIVKVAINNSIKCIYFSRSPIPFERNRSVLKPTIFRHIGIYCFKRDMLLKYRSLKRTYLEETESLEQMRLIENGIDIYAFITKKDYRKIDNTREFNKIKGKM